MKIYVLHYGFMSNFKTLSKLLRFPETVFGSLCNIKIVVVFLVCFFNLLINSGLRPQNELLYW